MCMRTKSKPCNEFYMFILSNASHTTTTKQKLQINKNNKTKSKPFYLPNLSYTAKHIGPLISTTILLLGATASTDTPL